MRILIDGKTLRGNKTGIGWYTHRLLLAIATRGEVEDVGVAVGPCILSLSEAMQLSPPAARRTTKMSRMASALRSFASDVVPLARDVLMNTQALRLRRRLGDWTLFHQPNYVSPRLPLPLVTTVCDMSYVSCPQWLPRERRLWLQRSLGKCLERSGAIATISHFTRGELLAHFPRLDARRVFATPLGVDHERFRPQRSVEDTSLHARLNLPPSFVLYLGTLEPRKNLQGLLRAYATLPRALQNEFPLVLAGVAGWERQHFQVQLDELQRLGVVQAIGYVAQNDVPALLRAATVFAFPSLYEGFGLPVLEAAACGTPVLCSRSASLPEVLGEAAVYVDPTQPEEIAQKLADMLADEPMRQRLSLAGHLQSQKFSWEDCAAQTMRAYQAAA